MANILLSTYDFNNDNCFDKIKKYIKPNMKVIICPFTHDLSYYMEEKLFDELYNFNTGKDYNIICDAFYDYGIAGVSVGYYAVVTGMGGTYSSNVVSGSYKTPEYDSGYRFFGWSEDRDALEASYIDESDYLSKVVPLNTDPDITLYAVWNKSFDTAFSLSNKTKHDGYYKMQDATPEICHEIINRHLASPAMLTILPLQDWISIDGNIRFADPEAERINVPANPTHYWRYRMHLTLEQLLAADEFNNEVLRLVHSNYR